MSYCKKPLIVLVILAFLITGIVAGCGGKQVGTNNEASSPEVTDSKAQGQAKVEKTKLDFWYLWGGEEGKVVEDLIASFNKSQDQYEVKGLSVPDVQKIVVAISSGTGPDVTDNFSDNVASYAEKGLLLPLDEYISKDKYDISDFAEAALKTCRYKGKIYALPINVTTFMLYYNKKLFADAGIAGPPKTDKELLEYAVKLTRIDKDGSIEVLGYPDFPNVYFLHNMTFALGGDYISSDGKLTTETPGTIAALKNIVEYRKKFGADKVLKFISSAKYLDAAADPFITGKQAMRIDGPWFGPTVKNTLKIANLDYGMAPMPYPDGKPELERGGQVQTSIFFVSNSSKNKDGAWAFLSWLYAKPQMIAFCSKMGNFPSRQSIMTDNAFASVPDFNAYAEQVKSKNLKGLPVVPVQSEFAKILKDESELAMNLKKTPEEAMKAATEKANALK